MPEDVNAAMLRFEAFLSRWPGGGLIDEQSGFTSNDGFLIYSELEMLEQRHAPADEDPIY